MEATLDRPARQKLAHETRRFLAGDESAFAFDKAIFAIHDDTRDETVRTIVRQLWLFYDDCQDHDVALTKLAWDYIQRLLLVLESNRRLVHSSTRHWHWTQLIALSSLLGFAACIWFFGFGGHLLVFAMPFGLISMAISSWRLRLYTAREKQHNSLSPFYSFAELRATYRATPNFQKQKYRPELESVRVRSRLGEFAAWLPTTAGWLMLAPIPLVFQTLPTRGIANRVV